MAKNAETFIILKYGSMENALVAWIGDETRTRFTAEEDQIMSAHAKKTWPNLDLKRLIGNMRG